MSNLELLIRLFVVAALASYLYAKHRQRERSLAERYDPAEWTGTAIDVTPLKPRIEGVRRDYLAAQQPSKGLCFHRALLELARRAVAQLAYFHDRAPEHHAQTHSH
jgi:hypothetical protein